MRPHHLRVTAFGAFAATERVPFDDLEGLFLLHGETGAGKTTLLDAIAFALYGRVPGERGSARRLRSDHAAAGTVTEVELEVTLGGRRLRITRKPEQTRPKARGAGFTIEQASVRLEELAPDGTWAVKSTRIGEADAEIEQLMGMSAAQFFQVALLPQGEFAKFLRADAKDKEALLQKLFGTDRFRRVEDWLAERRRATDKEVTAAEDAIGQLVARIAQAAGTTVPGSAAVLDSAELAGPLAALAESGRLADRAAACAPGSRPPGGAERFGSVPDESAFDGTPSRRSDYATASPMWQATWAAALGAAAASEQDAAAALVDVRKTDLDAALAAQRQAEHLADRQRRRRDALRRQGELEAAAPEIERLRAEVGAAARAAEISAILDGLDAADDAVQSAREAEESARTAVGEAHRNDPVAALRASAQAQRAQLGRLDALRTVAGQAVAEDEAAAGNRARGAEFADSRARFAAEVQQRQTVRRSAQEARDSAALAAAALPAAQARADVACRIADNSAALVTELAKRDDLHEAHLTARERQVAAQTEALQVRAARIDGMRAELAAQLTDGAPCPVCGSADHPEPVDSTSFPPVSWDAEEDAFARANDATAAAAELGKQVAAADAVIGDLAQRLTASGFAVPDLSAVDGRLRLAAAGPEAAGEASVLEAAAMRLAAVTACLADLQGELDALDEANAADTIAIAELTQQRASALAAAEAAAGRAQERRGELRAQLGDAVDLDAAVSAATQLTVALTGAADAADASLRAEAAAANARRRAVQEAAGRRFGPVPTAGASDDLILGAARAALRPPQWRADSSDQIARHDADRQAVADLLADPDLDVALEPPAPVDEKTTAAGAAQQALDHANAAYGQARHSREQLAALQPQLEAALAVLSPLTERAAQVRHLADLANGLGTANQYKMTLSSFVLAARLEEVAAAASERLLLMTAGRYSLVHSDARKGNAKAGLSLVACDSWTGQDRDTATLSGGETFLASLALALGLADVVTAESAGTPMEALFVDEGFGTLDEDTLDEVMTVLDGLRAGGRLVGIVSHVSELRQRIPAQVRVRKSRTGSHVEINPGS